MWIFFPLTCTNCSLKAGIVVNKIQDMLWQHMLTTQENFDDSCMCRVWIYQWTHGNVSTVTDTTHRLGYRSARDFGARTRCQITTGTLPQTQLQTYWTHEQVTTTKPQHDSEHVDLQYACILAVVA
jgi:hypothetical protein